MNRTVLIVGTLITVPLLVFLALSFGKDPRAIDSPLIGKPAPAFALRDLDGQPLSLADLRGQPAVLNFWATWCQPCIVEHPVLMTAAREYAGRVRFVGIVYQDEPELIRRFQVERGAWGPALVDPDGSVAIAYGVYGAPETFFLDSTGTVRRKVTGALGRMQLASLIEELP